MKLIAAILLPVALALNAAGQSTNRLQPLLANQVATSTHTPFANGECQECHQSKDPKQPGPVIRAGNALCVDCHEDFHATLARKFRHAGGTNLCVTCHNPHNSKEAKLLLDYSTTLCGSCHEKVQQLASTLPVRHGALTQGRQCVGCHDPHAADFEHLLRRPTQAVCLECHDRNNVVDHTEKKLTNLKKWFEENPRAHGTIGSDCNACHEPHASAHFRLLRQPYPAELYVPFSTNAYALCFECHEERAFTEPETETATQFRDGKRNLHFLHVNRAGPGRACRLCHETHSSKREALMREGIPYEDSGWVLRPDFAKTANGGACGQSCHSAQTYQNRASAPAAPPSKPQEPPP